MRVLYITYPDYIYSSGLIWNQVFSLLNKLCQKDPQLRVTLLCFVPLPEWLKRRKRAQVIRKHLHPHMELLAFPALLKRNWILPLYPLFFLTVVCVAKWVVGSRKPNLLHSRGLPASWIASLSHGKAPWALDMRGLFPEEGVKLNFWGRTSLSYHLWKRIEKRLIEKCHAVNFVSEKMKSHFANQVDPKKVVFIPSGVDTQTFSPAPSQPQSNRFVLVYSGSLAWESLSNLQKIFRTVSKVKPNAHLEILLPHVSKKREKREMEAFSHYFDASELSIQRCWPEEVPDKLLSAHFGLLTRHASSVTEVMWPIKCLEYWACGLPVLTTEEVDSVKKWIDQEKIGLVLTLTSEQKDQDRLISFFAEAGDIQKRCRQVAERYFSLDHAANAYLELYRKLTG